AAPGGRRGAQVSPELRAGRLRVSVQVVGEVAEPDEAPPVGSREGVPAARAFARNGGRAAPRPSAYRALRALDAGHSWRRGEEDNGAPIPRAGALPAPLAGVQGPDGRLDRPGFVQ